MQLYFYQDKIVMDQQDLNENIDLIQYIGCLVDLIWYREIIGL